MTRIDGFDGPGGPGKPGKPERAGKGEKRRFVEPSRGDRVDLSSDSRRVGALVEAARNLPEIRLDKVEPLRRAIADGTYEVDPRVLARAILEFEDGLPR